MPFGLLGEKLAHSFSPLIHSVFGDYEYILFPVEPEEVPDFLQRREFDGLNVTIPYKQTVIPYCASLSPIARRLNSVNTITVKNGQLYGDNTDYAGFLHLLRTSGITVKGKKALILGSGGSSHTVNAVCADEGAREIIVVSRTGKVNYENIALHSDAEVIINTTPVGMYPNNGESPVDLALFPNLEAVVDIIYNPQRTALLLQAEKRGLKHVNGLPMLAAQAKYAAELFCGARIDDALIDKAVEVVNKKTRNLVFIGMPGSGKSTIGRMLASRLGMKFIDTDELVREMTGRTPAEIIKNDGEPAFRAIERQAAKEAGKQTSSVIATGGGIVLDERNIDTLRQNGLIIFLDRSLEKLDTSGRPLSSSYESLKKLYEFRYPLYQKYADIVADSNLNLETAAEKIYQLLQ